ncbi:hypothetical protein PRIPAC_90265 [Pristionchus pacificus]|nr:hypothetical protein PRIPAC_90265 [Pristionchus pacificus]
MPPSSILLLLFLPFTSSHVSLTFPSSRYPPLDFLDSLRTKGPCGVPVPRKQYLTNLIINKPYNITWRMGYPHQGGYRLTLIDGHGDTVAQLTPTTNASYVGTMDQTEMKETVVFPKECSNCSILLQRQAIEWGKAYTFHSCADVNIVSEETEDTQCNGRGRMKEGKCDCDPGFGGKECKSIVHCSSDEDCGKGGKCIEERGTLVVKTCFCPYGQFGRNCDTQFNGLPDNCFAYNNLKRGEFNKHGMFNEECYMSKQLNSNDTVYYRHLKSEDEVEVILDFDTTSWVGLGWRPDGLDPSCRLFPDLEGARYRRQSPSFPSESTEMESFPTTSLRDSTAPTRTSQDGPIPVMPKSNGLLSSALHAPLHPMDCIDMIIGAVRNGRSRIQDLYSRDRSTPIEDHWYDGLDSLSAAYGIEVDGRTIIMFRRNRQEIEPTDHPLGGTRQFIVWAKGQTKGGYSHSAPSAFDKGSHSISADSFYADDVVNYHGDKNRGVFKGDLAQSIPSQDVQKKLRDPPPPSSSSSSLPPLVIHHSNSITPSSSQSQTISPSVEVIDDSIPPSQSSSFVISSLLSIVLLRLL